MNGLSPADQEESKEAAIAAALHLTNADASDLLTFKPAT